MDESHCDKSAPTNQESCNMHDCPSWSTSKWGPCSCETGQRNRTVNCMYKDNLSKASMCESINKPIEIESCEQSNCPIWKKAPWSQCSASCGTGFKTRKVHCIIEKK